MTANGDDYVLINPSPDIRVQIDRTSALHPRARRDSPIAAIVLTNGDVDHWAGLLSLREWQPLAVYATASVRRGLIEHNIVFRTLDRFPGHLTWREITTDSDTDLHSSSGNALGLSVRAIAVPGKVPLHLEGIAPSATDDNIGILIREQTTNPVFAYFPSVSRITDTVRRSLAQAAVVAFDGTFWSSDELIREGVGARTSEEMAHVPIGGQTGSLSVLSDLPAASRLFTHINNTNPILRKDSPERAAVAAAGWSVACDGMELKL